MFKKDANNIDLSSLRAPRHFIVCIHYECFHYFIEELQDIIEQIEEPCHANYGSYDDAKHEQLEADLNNLEKEVFDWLEANPDYVPEDRKLRKLAQLLRGLAQVMAQKHNFN